MASRQLGKLRQWAGEVISSRDKTTVSEEFAELEKDIELRRDGALKLLAASECYQKCLSKKKKCDAFKEGEKLLPINALGMVMVLHGEEFGEDSAFGTSLINLGRAHCRVGTLQESFALAFKETFLTSIESLINDIKEYDVQRKKLDSRRLSYDASVTKVERLKSSKKEKEKKDADEEMEKAKRRYEETSEEVQAHMHTIQEKEEFQLRELSFFLDLEITFVEQYLHVLMDTRSELLPSNATSINAQSSRVVRPAHNFKRADSTQSRSSNSVKSRSESPEGSRSAKTHRPSLQKNHDPIVNEMLSRQPSISSSRKRADSTNTIDEKSDREKDKDKDSQKNGKLLSVADWATSAVGSAVGSVTGKSKKGREKFSSLYGDDGEEEEDSAEDKGSPKTMFQAMTKKLSREKAQNESLKPQAKILRPRSLRDRKVATALHSFQGANDELSFEVGDEIIVVNEVLDGWWMGDLRGKQGLFPTTHVVVSTMRSGLIGKPPSRHSPGLPSEEEAMKGLAEIDSLRSEVTEQEEDHDLAQQPFSPCHDSNPFYSAIPLDDNMSINSFVDGEDDLFSLAPPQIHSGNPAPSASSKKSSPQIKEKKAPPIPVRSGTHLDGSLPTKKVPPPPPPRRATVGTFPSPSIPARPPRIHLHASIPITPTSSQSSNNSYDRSPFESVADLQNMERCSEFKQNPLRASRSGSPIRTQ